MATRQGISRLLAVALALGIGSFHAAPAQACACCESYRVNGVADWDNLKVRNGPGTQYGIIGQLEAYQCGVQLTGNRQGNWVQIQYGENSTGWVNGKYLQWTP